MTLSNTFQEFLITQELRGNSEKTVKYYSNCLSPMVNFIGGNIEVSSLSVKQLREYALNLKQRDISSNSFKTYLKGIKAF